MIYILIVLWFGDSTSYSGKAALAVEFNDKQSCLNAANMLREQSMNRELSTKVGVVMCAPKGAK